MRERGAHERVSVWKYCKVQDTAKAWGNAVKNLDGVGLNTTCHKRGSSPARHANVPTQNS
jgi:hypothetical protein